jgi:excisionase family DNA binding protein
MADTRAHRPLLDGVPDRLLDVHAAAELLGLKPATLYQWAYEKRIAVVKPSGLRFRLSTLLRLIEEWEQPARRPLPARRDG